MTAAGRFVAMTFALTWLLWAVVIRASHGATAPASSLLGLGGPVFLIGVFAPGIVAVILTAMEEGRAGVRVLLQRIAQWQVDARYYAFAILLMPVTKLVVAVLHRALTGTWPQFGETRPLVLLGATALSTIFQAGEEVGWRGYLLPRLWARAGLGPASLIVGVIWAAWHLPLFSAPGADTYHQSFPLFALQVTAYSIALAWLYWRTGGSLLLPMLMHSAFNNMKDIVPSGGVTGGGTFTFESTLVLRLTVLLLWGMGFVLLVRMRGMSLPLRPVP
jgi:membrane protease YdiL (CAAX protease family)